MFDHWPPECVAVGNAVLALLDREGATPYQTEDQHREQRNEPDRVGWLRRVGTKHVMLAAFQLEPDYRVRLKLRVRPDHPYFFARRWLVKPSDTADASRGSGLMWFRPSEGLPPHLQECIDEAFAFTRASREKFC